MSKMKTLAIKQRNEAMTKLARLESNHHVSYAFRHGIRNWVEPNGTNRLTTLEVATNGT